jgi:transcription factor TGA
LTFDIEYARWLEDQNKQINELRTTMNAHASDNVLRLIVDGIMADVFHILLGCVTWRS